MRTVVFHTISLCRREEAAERPKVEFVPKSLADLNIEGVSDGVNGTHHSNTSLNIQSHNTYNISNNQFKKPAVPKSIPSSTQPDPFDPWIYSQGSFLLFFLFFKDW